MFSHRLHQLTAYALLVLIGLVGSLGTGLHDIFDCNHQCPCDDCSDVGDQQPAKANTQVASCNCVFCHARQRAPESSPGKLGKRPASQSLATPSANCAICQFLGHFQITTATSALHGFVFESAETIVCEIPCDMGRSSLRLEPPRGPPAVAIAVC